MYKPKRISSFEPSPAGVARVKLLQRPKIGVQFNSEAGEFADKKYVVTKLPDYINNPKFLDEKEWYIRLNNDGTEIFSISPIEGDFVGHCVGLAREEGKPPVPKSKTNQYGIYFYFLALIEIIEDQCKGMTVAHMLRYNFGEEENGNVGYTQWNSDLAVYSPKLHEFLTITGVWEDGPIKFSDNILPTIHKRIITKDKSFKFLMKDGWIDRLWSGDRSKQEPVPEEKNWADDGWESDAEANPTDESLPVEEKEEEDFSWD